MCSGGFMGASITKVTSKYLADQKLFEGEEAEVVYKVLIAAVTSFIIDLASFPTGYQLLPCNCM